MGYPNLQACALSQPDACHPLAEVEQPRLALDLKPPGLPVEFGEPVRAGGRGPLRELFVLRCSLEEFDPEQRLELGDRDAQGLLRHVNPLGSTPEVELLSHRDEVLQLTDVRTHRGERTTRTLDVHRLNRGGAEGSDSHETRRL
jgi:hypothetical protein